MALYGKLAQKEVKETVEEFKHGELKSGKSNIPVRSMNQAIAIGLSKAGKKGAKMPPYRPQ